jgi:hypothetical protein
VRGSRHLKPGGWVEFCDYDFLYGSDDGTLTRDLSLVQNNRMTLDASNSLGRDPCPGPKLKQWVEEAGFKEVQELCYKLPLGPWPKDRRMVGRSHHGRLRLARDDDVTRG